MARTYATRWKRADFRGWKYEKLVGLPPTEKVFDVYPHLKSYPELNKKYVTTNRLSFDKVLRYVMIYYSDNALRYAYPEVMRRKREAAFIAGFEYGKLGTFGPDVEKMIMCQEPTINKMIVRLLRRENSSFQQICVFEESKAQQMQKLVDGIPDNNKEQTKVVVDNIKTLSQDIERLERELLNDDTNSDLLEMMYDEVDYSNLGLSPEEIAEHERNQTLELVLEVPYKSIYDGSRQRMKNRKK